MLVVHLLLLTLASDSIPAGEALSEQYYKNDCFLGYEPALGDVINRLSDLTLVHCSAFCVVSGTVCRSFFHNPDDNTCSLLVIIPGSPSGIRQLSSANVLYSPIKPTQPFDNSVTCTTEPQTTVLTTTETPTSEHPLKTTGCLTNIEVCLDDLDHEFPSWDTTTCLAFIGPTTISIDEANSTCHCLGGNLISLDTDHKFDSFYQYLETRLSEHGRVAIGVRAETLLGQWVWPNANLLDSIPSFCPDEPNGDTSNILAQRCAVLEFPSGCMDDRNCPGSIDSIYFACEYF